MENLDLKKPGAALVQNRITNEHHFLSLSCDDAIIDMASCQDRIDEAVNILHLLTTLTSTLTADNFNRETIRGMEILLQRTINLISADDDVINQTEAKKLVPQS